MSGGRMRRVDEAIRQVIGGAVAGELKDPRVGFVTVTDVKTSADLSHAHVYVSVLDETGIRAAGACPPASSETGTDWGDTRSARIPKSASAAGACPPASSDELGREQTLAGLRSAHGYLQGRIAAELHLKRTPTLDFIYDDTTDRAMRLERLLSEPEGDGDE
ncbi:MAG TPA: 30S ribosome-binding factor RbfA [Solirubrobacteraceae bacterium]|jgi:ribosome-binding factor A|nr:30S ribosome-binding factor RbfA [Solirubrobacteraceae bacterium]